MTWIVEVASASVAGLVIAAWEARSGGVGIPVPSNVGRFLVSAVKVGVSNILGSTLDAK